MHRDLGALKWVGSGEAGWCSDNRGIFCGGVGCGGWGESGQRGCIGSWGHSSKVGGMGWGLGEPGAAGMHQHGTRPSGRWGPRCAGSWGLSSGWDFGRGGMGAAEVRQGWRHLLCRWN